MSGIPSWVRKGAKCVCVTDDWGGPENYPGVEPPSFAPSPGDRLTVLTVVGDFLLFEELPAEYDTPLGRGFVTWPPEAFRPLVAPSIEQDIAIFAPLLDQPILEDA